MRKSTLRRGLKVVVGGCSKHDYASPVNFKMIYFEYVFRPPDLTSAELLVHNLRSGVFGKRARKKIRKPNRRLQIRQNINREHYLVNPRGN